ncbi:MAG: M15 family metallopeptidase [Spirochaetes bacterium]|nr:M15 family metallopeptidase [Spirochaetota bacterium]
MRARLAPLLLLAALAGCTSRQPVSPRFSYTKGEFRAFAATLPSDVSVRALAEPERFLELLAGALGAPTGVLQLVDKAHGLDRSWTPSDLVDLSGGKLSLPKAGLRLRTVAMEDLLAMSDAAHTDGAVLTISSAWRSWDTQAALRAKALETQPREQVDRELAAPGHSQHQLGTAIDLGSIDDSFADTAAGRWMAANAWRYGWSMSYPRDRESETGYRWESWHFRWIGRPAAELVQSFFGDSQQQFLEFYAASETALRAKLRMPA